jgi:hypothetical protein
MNLFTARSVNDKVSLTHIPGWYDARREILEQLNRTGLFGSSPRLEQIVGRRTAQWLADYYAEDNRKLAKSHGLPLADFGYPMEASGVPDRDRPGRWRSILRF